MRTRITGLATLAGLVLALALLAGCGGDDGGSLLSGDSDPQEVLDTTFNSDTSVDSGVLDLTFDASAEGATGGEVTAELQGPFQSTGESTLPELDLDASLNADAAGQQQGFEGSLTLTGDGAFVGYGGTDYQVDDPTFATLQQAYEQSAQLNQDQDTPDSGAIFDQLGVDPSAWLADVSNEGTEDLDGTEVVHVSGSADIGAIVADLQKIAAQTGQAQEVDPTQLKLLESAVSSATIDVYSGTDDGILRKLDVVLELASPQAGVDSATVSLSIGLSDVNEDQEISAPEDAQPIAGLLSQIPGASEALGGIGATGSGVPDTGSDSGSIPGDSLGGSGEDYAQCIAKAKDPAEIQDCAELLQ